MSDTIQDWCKFCAIDINKQVEEKSICDDCEVKFEGFYKELVEQFNREALHKPHAMQAIINIYLSD